ncbi:TRADD-N-associated membrane domain-containing protein [Streptomyces globisporus]
MGAAVAALAAGAGVFTAVNGDKSNADPVPGWLLGTFATVVALAVFAGIGAIILRERRKAAARRDEQARLDNAAEKLRERMELASLVNFNRVLLEKYHGVATRQANKSFVSALAAMTVGLLVLVGAFIASMHFNELGERLFIGSLAVLATAFVGYLSKTFLAVYDRSLQQLNQYFNQPVLNGYFLTAERIVERLDDPMKQELTAQIVMDVLETGKEMHQLSVSRAAEPKPRLKVSRQRKPQTEQAGQP